MRGFAVFLLLAVAASSAAAEVKVQLALDDGDFAAQRARIEADLADGETYSEIGAADRTTVRESLDAIDEQLAAAGSPEALSDAARVAVFNQQEIVNTILSQAAADSRVVCERRSTIGSNRKTTVCLSVAERARRRREDGDDMRRIQQGEPTLGNPKLD